LDSEIWILDSGFWILATEGICFLGFGFWILTTQRREQPGGQAHKARIRRARRAAALEWLR
jgi:hypothetical protein